MNKKSFTLFEVLVSLVILSVVISGVSKLYTKKETTETYYELQNMENEFIATKKVTSTQTIKIKSY